MWSEDTVFSTLRPVWTLTQIFGLCNRPLVQKNKTKLYRIFVYFYVAVALALVTFITYKTSELEIITGVNVITQYADFLFRFFNNISMITSVVFCLWYQEKLSSVVGRIHKIDNEFKNKLKWTSYKSVKIFVLCELVFTLSIWISFFIQYVIDQCKGTTAKCFRSWLILYMSTKISQVVLVDYLSFVVVLRHKLSLVNVNMRELLQKSNDKVFNKLETLFGQILIVCNDVQGIFSVPLLMKVANQFVTIFCLLYFCIFGYIYNEQLVRPQNFKDAVIPFVCILIAVVELITTVTICELTIIEFRNTGKLIYRIPVTGDKTRLVKRVNLLGLQVLQKNLEFTACGFFKINGSLLQTIMGAVTVYLVMFIQFDIATNKPK